MNIQDIVNILTQLVTILGVPILIATIILLIRQLRIQAYQAIYESALTVDQFLLEHPELRRYIYEGKALPENDPEELERISGAADMMLTFFEHIQGQKHGMSKAKRLGWESFMRNVYKNSPALQYCFERKEEWYSDELKELLLQRDAV